MGEFNTIGLEEVAERFGRMEAAADRAVPEMLQAGAEVVVKAQQQEAESMGIKGEDGGFIQSIKATQVKEGAGGKYVEVYPQGRAKHGNDRKGDKSRVRYATIGFVNQYGTSKTQARPYMTAANEKAHDEVTEAMFKVWQGEQQNG